ncbi:MAG: metallophosphoesterase [Clostridia bacterium]|nr:metallophosphoesterase [Clostridia bacterium]
MKKLLVFGLALVAAVLLSIGAFATETVIYENDFSDASTLSDFTEYRHEWEIRDGALYNTSTVIDGESSIYGHIIYNGVKDLTDYIVEVDYLNVQAAGGIIFNADGESVDHQKNGIYGYVASVGSNGNKGYLGYGKDDGTWGDYINTGAVAFEKGANIHIKVIVKGTYVNVEMTNIDTGEIVYSYVYTIGSDVEHVVWNGGSVGLRLAGYVACMDNFKITTAKYVKVPGETVIYENDFSDASTLSDFTQYRHAWEIKDGALYATSTTLDDSVSGAMSHILYNATETLTDYIVEVDYLNPATTGGLVFRADESLASHANNGFYGYIAFVASDANKGAFGYANAEGAWGGNINVGSVAFEKGDDIHIKATVKGDYVKIEMTKLETGELVYTYTYSIGANAAHTAWNSGTVGLRLNGTSGCFDNFKITTVNNVEVPSDTPADEFGEGMTFGEHTGRYMFEKELPSMPLTFEATMYFPYNTTSDYTHIIMSNFERTQTGFIFEITKGGQPSIMFYDEADVRTRYTFSNVSVYNGKKTHIAIAADVENSKIHCYVDGEIAQSLDLAINPLEFEASHMAFGTDNREVNLNLFRGALINVACYADTRTADEIKADMTTQGTDDLILHFDMSKMKYGEDAIDLSDSKNNAVYEQYWYDEIDNITDYAYSIAVVGDTQHNVQYQPETFAKLYDWLKANAADKKMAFMLGLGDITNDNTDEQWTYSLENIAKLDGILPYALCRGNHDGSANSYSARFDDTPYAAAIGENYYSNRANSYQEFKVGDVNYLVITLNYNPSDAELAWAKGIADAHPYHRVIAITHSNLRADGEYNIHGENVWNKFAKLCPNVEMVLSGHVFNDKIIRVESVGDAGNVVKQFMINGQCADCTRIYDDKEAAGLVAIFYFDESGKNLKVEYYSTSLNKYFMECNQFETTIGNIAGDTNYDGEVSFGDVMNILKAAVNESVCYNGDANGDAKLGLADVLATLKNIVK